MKTNRRTGPSFALLFALSPVLAHAGLTCDLNAGSLNTVRLGAPADGAALAAALGVEPGRVDEDFPTVRGYLFPEHGVEAETVLNDGTEVVHDLSVYFAAGTDFYGAPVRRYPGEFVPALGARETVDGIRKKLGAPFEEHLPASGVSEPSLLIFRRPFGKLTFLFGVDGVLRHITLSTLGPGDKGWSAPPKKPEAPARAESAPRKPEPPPDAWARNVLFPDAVPDSAGALLAAKPWTGEEKREVLAVLSGIRGREPGLTDRASGYRPLALYRTGRIGSEAADALTDQRMNALFLGDSFFGFNTAGMSRILTHELAHLADAFGRHSGDPAWLTLTEGPRARVEGRMAALGMSVHGAALAAKSEYEEEAKKEGFFSLWSCLSPSETLADAAADQSLGRSPTLPGVDAHVRRKLLSAFVRDPWEESMHAGSAAMASGKWDAAIEAFSAAAGHEPSLGTAFLFRAEAWEKKGDLSRARADLDRAVEGRAGSEAYLRRAKLRVRDNEADKAVSDLTEYIKLVPWMGSGYELRASAYRAQGALDLAVRDYSTVLELSPGNTQARARRGDLHYARKDYDKAIADFSWVIEKDPGNAATALVRRARCWLGKSDPGKAMSDLEAALKANPRDWTAVGLLMEASFARGDHARVLTEAQGILRLNPKNIFARQMRGRSLLAERRWEEAAAEFAELIKLEPGSADAYAGRAKAELESATPFNSGHYKAYDDYAKAVSLSTPTAQLLYEKGGAAWKCGMFNVAQGDYFQAAALAPERVDILLAKAEMELLLWRQDKASNWYFSAQVTITQARRLAPEGEEVKALAARIMSETPR